MAKTNMAKTNSNPKNIPPVPDADAQLLIEEVNAEVHAEQVKHFLNRYGKFIIGALVLIVLGTAMGNAMIGMQAKDHERDSAALIMLLDKDIKNVSADEAKATLLDLGKMAQNGSGEGHRVAARLGEAGVAFNQGNVSDALKALQALSSDQSVKPLYRDYAKLLELRARVDKDDAQTVLNALMPLTDAKNPWRISALELSAVLYAKLGQKDKAVEQLNKLIIDVDATTAVVERAKLLARVYKAQ